VRFRGFQSPQYPSKLNKTERSKRLRALLLFYTLVDIFLLSTLSHTLADRFDESSANKRTGSVHTDHKIDVTKPI